MTGARRPGPAAVAAKWVQSGRLAGTVVQTGSTTGPPQTFCHGWMDLNERLPMRPDAVFRLGSATKLLSCVAALTLLDCGLLHDLDDPVSKYLPRFEPAVLTNISDARGDWRLAPAHRTVTVRDLMRHTSGLQYGFGLNPLDAAYQELGFPKWGRSLADFVAGIASLPLAFQPGTQVCYGYGIDVLGHVMEVICHQPLDQLMQERLTGPLNMVDTGFFVSTGNTQRIASHHECRDGKLVPGEPYTRFLSRPVGLSAGGGWLTGYGGMVSTAEDFGKVLAMLLADGRANGKRLLSPRSVAEVFGDQTAAVPTGMGLRYPPALDVAGRGFGLGGAVQSSPDVGLLHWGGAPYNTSFVVDRKLGVYGLLLAQTGPFEGEFAPAGMKAVFRQAVRATASG